MENYEKTITIHNKVLKITWKQTNASANISLHLIILKNIFETNTKKIKLGIVY